MSAGVTVTYKGNGYKGTLTIDFWMIAALVMAALIFFNVIHIAWWWCLIVAFADWIIIASLKIMRWTIIAVFAVVGGIIMTIFGGIGVIFNEIASRRRISKIRKSVGGGFRE